MFDGCSISESSKKTTEFTIFTKQGISYPIMAATVESKNEWIIQINNVRRCHEIRNRANRHIQESINSRKKFSRDSYFNPSSFSSSPSLSEGFNAGMNTVRGE